MSGSLLDTHKALSVSPENCARIQRQHRAFASSDAAGAVYAQFNWLYGDGADLVVVLPSQKSPGPHAVTGGGDYHFSEIVGLTNG